jgi:phosphoribosylaminoimidazolecarboxamide formyltransferase/IMP cyclohydrolase
VVVNLYPFEETLRRAGATHEELVEKVDIGGPAMVRAAAKNHARVTVVVDPADYALVLAEFERDGDVGHELRVALAAKAFAHTSRYDGDRDLPLGCSGDWPTGARRAASPRRRSISGYDRVHPALRRERALRGGHQAQQPVRRRGGGDHRRGPGKGLGGRSHLGLRFGAGLHADPGPRLGAGAFYREALELLTQKPKWGKSVRLLACGPFGPSSRRESDLEWKQIVGGFLLQTRDLKAEGEADCKVVTRTAPTAAQLEGLIFANRIAKHVKSNAIAIAAGTEILGVGAGQMSRVDSVRLAVHKSGERVRGSVLASDAFFPFPDGVEAAIAAGVTAILQPGGSVRDAEVIAACDKAGVPMVFTSSRHFRH